MRSVNEILRFGDRLSSFDLFKVSFVSVSSRHVIYLTLTNRHRNSKYIDCCQAENEENEEKKKKRKKKGRRREESKQSFHLNCFITLIKKQKISMMRLIKWDRDLLICCKVEMFVVEKNKTACEKKVFD